MNTTSTEAAPTTTTRIYFTAEAGRVSRQNCYGTDRKAAQMFVNRNNAWCRRNGQEPDVSLLAYDVPA